MSMHDFYAFAGDWLLKALRFQAVNVSVIITKSLWTWFLTNCLWKFHQIYNLCAVGDKDEPSTFCCHIVKFMLRPNVVKKHFGNFECHVFKQVTDNISNEDS